MINKFCILKNEMKKELILKSVVKMLTDKDAVRSFIKGKKLLLKL